LSLDDPPSPELVATQWYSPSLYYLLLSNSGGPECYNEALMSNQTWELTELLHGKNVLHNKWVYRIKEEQDDNKLYKARLVLKGFQPKEGA
jgi:uncharacterized protein (DUF2225 family)